METVTAPTVERVQLRLRGAAREVIKCRAMEVLNEGPAGTGKSYGALWKLHLMCMQNPGMRALIVRKTGRSLAATGLVTFREKVATHAIKAKILKWYGGSAEKPAQYTYENGSVIVVGGMDNADKIMSSDYDVIFAQEATDLSLDDIEKLTTRLRNHVVSFQQLIMDCNPQQPSHWLNQRCKDGGTVRLLSRHEDNPLLFDDGGQITAAGVDYLGRLDALSGVRYLRLRKGMWAAAEGIIYEGWDPAVHFVQRQRMPLDWTRIWSVDFGFIHPFVWQQWAIDPDGRMYLEKEIYQTKRLVEDHAREILKVVKKKPRTENNGSADWPTESAELDKALAAAEWKYPQPRAVICDHDAEDRATLERYLGRGTVPATKTVKDGIEAVQSRLKVQADGKPRLFVLRDSLVTLDQERKDAGRPTCFADEIEGYVWKPRPNAVGGRERAEPDEPEKIDDDSMDTARYAVAYEDLAARPRVRWM